MEPQGWPLWAVSQSTGQVWAVVGWDVTTVGMRSQTKPMGIEVGPELDEPTAVVPSGPVRFFTDHEAVLRVTR